MESKTNLILFCGLACSGKSTISKQVAKLLTAKGVVIEHIELDSYIKKNFPKEGFIFDVNTRIGLDRIIAEDLKKKTQNNRIFILDAGNPLTKGREIYQKIFPSALVILIDTPLYVCFWRDIKRSLDKKSPINNFVYLKSLFYKLIGKKKLLLQGISIPFERPTKPNLVVKPNESIQRASERIVDLVV